MLLSSYHSPKASTSFWCTLVRDQLYVSISSAEEQVQNDSSFTYYLKNPTQTQTGNSCPSHHTKDGKEKKVYSEMPRITILGKEASLWTGT